MIQLGSNSIGKVFLGNTEIAKAYLGADLVFQKGGSGPSLPTGYTKLDYVETPSDSSVYINTGVTATNTTGFKIDAYTYDANASSGYGCLFGGRVTSNSSDFQLTTYTGTSGWAGTLRRGTSSENYNAHIPTTTRFTASLIGDVLTIGGSSYTTAANIASGKTIYLFALNNNGTADQFSHARIYSFKLYSGTTAILNYVPCYRDSDHEIGFYDTVNGTFVSPASGYLIGRIGQLEFHTRIKFDGTAQVQTDIIIPENGSISASAGHESTTGVQGIFSAKKDDTVVTGIWINSASTSSVRRFSARYDSTTTDDDEDHAGYNIQVGLFITPYKWGFGDRSYSHVKGSLRPNSGLTLGAEASGNKYTGRLSTVKIFGSDAQNALNAIELNTYTPVYTLKPCIYNGSVGYWCFETSTFYGNTAGSGTLTVND